MGYTIRLSRVKEIEITPVSQNKCSLDKKHTVLKICNDYRLKLMSYFLPFKGRMRNLVNYFGCVFLG